MSDTVFFEDLSLSKTANDAHKWCVKTPKRKRKHGTNLTLSRAAKRMGRQIVRATGRRSLTNLVEFLLKEAHREEFAIETAVAA